jgi:hypothetical protein
VPPELPANGLPHGATGKTGRCLSLPPQAAIGRAQELMNDIVGMMCRNDLALTIMDIGDPTRFMTNPQSSVRGCDKGDDAF